MVGVRWTVQHGTPRASEVSPASAAWPYGIWHLRVTWICELKTKCVLCSAVSQKTPILGCPVLYIVSVTVVRCGFQNAGEGGTVAMAHFTDRSKNQTLQLV